MEFHKGPSHVHYCFCYLKMICQTRLPSLFKFILFADDSTLSTSVAEENALVFTLTLNNELSNVNNWLTSNRICVNVGKTKYMIFSSRTLLHLTNINIVSATIEETNDNKFLGIIFVKHLTFKNHV